jgi:hypothetical protein
MARVRRAPDRDPRRCPQETSSWPGSVGRTTAAPAHKRLGRAGPARPGPRPQDPPQPRPSPARTGQAAKRPRCRVRAPRTRPSRATLRKSPCSGAPTGQLTESCADLAAGGSRLHAHRPGREAASLPGPRPQDQPQPRPSPARNGSGREAASRPRSVPPRPAPSAHRAGREGGLPCRVRVPRPAPGAARGVAGRRCRVVVSGHRRADLGFVASHLGQFADISPRSAGGVAPGPRISATTWVRASRSGGSPDT